MAIGWPAAGCCAPGSLRATAAVTCGISATPPRPPGRGPRTAGRGSPGQLDVEHAADDHGREQDAEDADRICEASVANAPSSIVTPPSPLGCPARSDAASRRHESTRASRRESAGEHNAHNVEETYSVTSNSCGNRRHIADCANNERNDVPCDRGSGTLLPHPSRGARASMSTTDRACHRAAERDQALRTPRRRQSTPPARSRPDRRAGRVLRRGRADRLRQVHHADPGLRPGAAHRRAPRWSPAGRCPGITPGVGFMFQNDAVFPWKSVLDNVAAGPRFRGQRRERGQRRPRATGCAGSGWPASRTATRTSCPAACASGSRWPRA